MRTQAQTEPATPAEPLHAHLPRPPRIRRAATGIDRRRRDRGGRPADTDAHEADLILRLAADRLRELRDDGLSFGGIGRMYGLAGADARALFDRLCRVRPRHTPPPHAVAPRAAADPLTAHPSPAPPW